MNYSHELKSEQVRNTFRTPHNYNDIERFKNLQDEVSWGDFVVF
jgi:hypothetical protein